MKTWLEAIADAAEVVGERDARLIVGHVADWTPAELAAHGDEAVNAKCQASMAVSQGRLLIRSDRNLYCIGEEIAGESD